MQHVHDGHAGDATGCIGRELLTSNPCDLQVRQTALQGVADFDACLLPSRVQQNQQSAGACTCTDLALTEKPLGLRVDRPIVGSARDYLNVDAEITIELVCHASELADERPENGGFVLHARVLNDRR